MMTGVPDKKIAFYAAHAYYPQLLRAGVKVYLYTAGFLHAKTVTLDDQFSLIGTCNWDIRSFILHDEVVAVFYDETTARHYAEQYERDVEDCREVTLEWMGVAQRSGEVPQLRSTGCFLGAALAPRLVCWRAKLRRHCALCGRWLPSGHPEDRAP